MLYSCMEVGLESDGRDRVCWVSSQVGGGRGVVGLGYMQTAMLKRQLTLEELFEGGLVSCISRGGGDPGDLLIQNELKITGSLSIFNSSRGMIWVFSTRVHF